MKIIILLLALLSLTIPVLNAQKQDNKLLIEEYLRQSEKQKKAGITMFAVGGGTIALGLLLIATSSNWDSPTFGGGIIMMAAGSITTLVGVPIIISSASTARKAAQLSVGTDSVRVISPNGSSLRVYPALNLSIPLNSTKR